MTICDETGLACNCQPDEGVPCSALNGGLKRMMLDWRAEAIRLQSRLDAQQPAAASAGASDEYELRALLAVKYAGSALYGDDGELQDNRAMPCIDFKRDSVAEIIKKMQARSVAALHTGPCKDCDVLGGCPEYCHCGDFAPVATAQQSEAPK